MKKSILLIMLIGLLTFMAGCVHSENLVENTPAGYSSYAPYISAYHSFENGSQPTEIISTPFTLYHWPAANYNSTGVIVFALYDINSNGSPELIIGYKHGNEREGHYFKVCDVYTNDGGSLKCIIACDPADEFYTINTHSIEFAEGNIIGTIMEYSLSPDGNLIEEYSISVAYDSIDHEADEIVQELGKPLNDTPAELDWKYLSEY